MTSLSAASATDASVDAVVALGGNVLDRHAALQSALNALDDTPGLTVRAVSPVYETEPVGGPEQPCYLNAVLLLRTTLSAEALLARARAVEHELGRERRERWGPRTIDIDLIIVGHEVSHDPMLTLPHPRAHERAFVLAPWADIDPDGVLPGHGPVRKLLARVGSSGVRRHEDLALELPG